MLIADGGGGYGGTDWSAKDVVAMWQALENQDTTPHWQLVSGWRKSYELTLQHMSQVKSYRENLAAAWPPEKSPAAAAYLARLDQLIESLQATYDAAVANYGAFSGATSALATSRVELKKVYDAYVANQTKLADFRAKASRPVGGKALAPPAKPPVTDAQMEQLNNQARVIMYGLSSEIIQARAILTKPKVYDPAMHRSGNGETSQDTPYTAPPIPPIVPLYPDEGTSRPPTHASGTALPASSVQPPVPPGGTGNHPGLVLGGVTQGSVIAPPTTGTGVSLPAATGGGPITGIINPASILPTPSAGGTGRGAVNPYGPSSATRSASGGMTPGAPRPLPPGGMIGGVPGTGVGPLGGNPRGAQRINPIGGVIAPSDSGRPTQPARATGQGAHSFIQQPQPTSPGGGRARERHDTAQELPTWDPENPWATVEGVSPVVVPPPPRRVDPGPAIGLG